MNRIRDLRRHTFDRYSDIKLLYLFENMIWLIEEGTFSDLTGLEVSRESDRFSLCFPARNCCCAHAENTIQFH